MRIEVCDLSGRMHSGIGAPGTMQSHRMPCDPAYGVLEMILNGSAMALTLPALKCITCVLDPQRNSHRTNPATTNVPASANSTPASAQPSASRTIMIGSLAVSTSSRNQVFQSVAVSEFT